MATKARSGRTARRSPRKHRRKTDRPELIAARRVHRGPLNCCSDKSWVSCADLGTSPSREPLRFGACVLAATRAAANRGSDVTKGRLRGGMLQDRKESAEAAE
jgi:hypothetical protein